MLSPTPQQLEEEAKVETFKKIKIREALKILNVFIYMIDLAFCLY